MQHSVRFITKLFACVLLLLGLFGVSAASAAGLKLDVPKGMRSFQAQDILVTAPSDGTGVLEVVSPGCIWWHMKDIPLTAGENHITWDGSGFDGEYLPAARFDMILRFTGNDGTALEAKQTFTMKKPSPALLYFIPETDTLWLDSGRGWHFAYQTITASDLIIKFAPKDHPDDFIGTLKLKGKENPVRDYWNGRLNGKTLPVGEYRVVCYAKGAPEYQKECMLTIAEGAPDPLEVGVTGPIIPSRHATDEEIWAMMTAPAVVFDMGEGAGCPIFDRPGKGAEVLGYVHGLSTALEVMRIEEGGKWAYVGAWILKKACYV